MSKPQTNNGREQSPEQGRPSTPSDPQCHFAHARKVIQSWPEWKRNVRCMPTSHNGNQSVPPSTEAAR